MRGVWSGIVTENVSKICNAQVLRRYLAVWFPYLTTDRLRREQQSQSSAAPDERPLVVVEKIKGALRLSAVDQQAAKLGLTRGLTLADARARISGLAVAEADAHADSVFLGHAAELCHRFTPSVTLDFCDGLILDITGCAHLFGGDAGLRTDVITRLGNKGLNVRASIASTPDAARALARFSKVDISLPGKDEAFAKRLPVAALAGLTRETVVALSRAGLKSIGDLSERPPQVLAARFGQDLVTQVMRTLGREIAPIMPLRPVPSVIAERHFAEPFTQMDALEGVLASLLDDVMQAMQARDEGGRIFEASFFRSDGTVCRLRVQTGRPSRDTAAVKRLYHERMETLADPLDPGFGFDCVRLAVPLTEALNAAQTHFDGDANDDDAVGELVDRLIVRFGRERVATFAARDTHDPDRDARSVSAETAPSERKSAAQLRVAWGPRALGEPPLRPLQLFACPQPIEALAEVPDGPPLRFRWRRVLHDIKRAEGPERIAPEWWRKSGDEQSRDYYRVEDAEGCRFWIFRQGLYGQGDALPRWYLHGVFA